MGIAQGGLKMASALDMAILAAFEIPGSQPKMSRPPWKITTVN